MFSVLLVVALFANIRGSRKSKNINYTDASPNIWLAEIVTQIQIITVTVIFHHQQSAKNIVAELQSFHFLTVMLHSSSQIQLTFIHHCKPPPWELLCDLCLSSFSLFCWCFPSFFFTSHPAFCFCSAFSILFFSRSVLFFCRFQRGNPSAEETDRIGREIRESGREKHKRWELDKMGENAEQIYHGKVFFLMLQNPLLISFYSHSSQQLFPANGLTLNPLSSTK